MMRKLLLALGVLLGSIASAAAQCNGVFPAQTLCGNPNFSPTQPTVVPISAFGTIGAITVDVSSVLGGTANGILYKDAGSILRNSGPLVSAVSNPTGNGQWSIGATTTLGIINIGQGSVDDGQWQNSAGTGVISIGHGATVPTLNGITGSTQCLQVNTSGVVAGSGGACGGGTPGGANTNVQFNNSSAFGGDAGFTYAGNGQATLALGTITTNLKALTITGTWNAGGVTFDAPLFMNITNTASSVSSLLADFQLGGTSLYTFGLGTLGGSRSPGLSILLAGSGDNPALWFNPAGGGAIVNGIWVSNVGTGSSTLLNFVAGGTTAMTLAGFNGNGAVRVGSTEMIGWTPGIDPSVGTSNNIDTALYRDAVAGITALANATTKTNATTFRVYNTTDHVNDGTAPTNYERLAVDWTTTANLGTLATQKGGTGTARGIAISPANGHTTFSGGVVPTANTCAGFTLGTGSSDGQGSITYTSATTCSITFGTAYTNAPFCQITPGSAASTSEVVSTTGGFTATFGTAQTAFSYRCSGV